MVQWSSRFGLVAVGLLGVMSLQPASAQYYDPRGQYADPRGPYGAPPPPPRYDPRGPYQAQRPPADDPRDNRDRQADYDNARNAQVRQRQEQYNQALVSLQREHNQGVVSLQQQFNQGRLNRAQLDAGIAQLGRQYDAQVAQQQRALPR